MTIRRERFNAERAVWLWEEGMSMAQVATSFNYSVGYLRTLLRKEGHTLTKTTKRGLDRQRVIAEFSLTHSVEETADKFYCTKDAVHTYRSRLKKGKIGVRKCQN